jgi:predicted nuclease of predicted toxin-antitoxin system
LLCIREVSRRSNSEAERAGGTGNQMKFLLDEGLPMRMVPFLENEGHEVAVCSHDYPRGLIDPDILALAHAERRILSINDNDSGDLTFSDRLPHSGVILFRVGDLPSERRIGRLKATLVDAEDQLR